MTLHADLIRRWQRIEKPERLQEHLEDFKKWPEFEFLPLYHRLSDEDNISPFDFVLYLTWRFGSPGRLHPESDTALALANLLAVGIGDKSSPLRVRPGATPHDWFYTVESPQYVLFVCCIGGAIELLAIPFAIPSSFWEPLIDGLREEIGLHRSDLLASDKEFSKWVVIENPHKTYFDCVTEEGDRIEEHRILLSSYLKRKDAFFEAEEASRNDQFDRIWSLRSSLRRVELMVPVWLDVFSTLVVYLLAEDAERIHPIKPEFKKLLALRFSAKVERIIRHEKTEHKESLRNAFRQIRPIWSDRNAIVHGAFPDVEFLDRGEMWFRLPNTVVWPGDQGQFSTVFPGHPSSTKVEDVLRSISDAWDFMEKTRTAFESDTTNSLSELLASDHFVLNKDTGEIRTSPTGDSWENFIFGPEKRSS